MAKIPCRVCGKMYDGTTHCSVTICQACAMFFRRSETWTDEVSCVTGKNDCRLDKAGKITCAACRYKKCIEVGLKSKKNCRSVSKHEGQSRNIATNNGALTVDGCLSVQKMNNMPTLKHFCYFFAHSVNSKTTNEYAMLREDGIELHELPGNRRMGQITKALSDKVTKFNIGQFKKLLDVAFPTFKTIDESFKNNLVYLMMFPMFEISSAFKTYRIFNDPNCKKMMCTETLYTDLEDLSGFLNPDDIPDPMDRMAILSHMEMLYKRYMDSTHRYMHQVKLTDIEYLAVVALTILDEDNYKENKQYYDLADKQRRLIYNDLDYYYKNILKMDNYVDRVMGFTGLKRIIKTNMSYVSETFNFLRVFNYFKTSDGQWDAAERMMSAAETYS